MNKRCYDSVSTSERHSSSVPTTTIDRGWLGWKILLEFNRDTWVLMGSKAVRLYSYGFLAVMLVIYLRTLSFSNSNIGVLLTLTLLGDAVVSIYLTSHADHTIGRKNSLLIGSGIAVLTSFIFALSDNFFILLGAGILGVISPSGGEMGPFMAIELSSIAQVSTSEQLTTLMAWYNLCGSVFAALGALSCGAILTLFANVGMSFACRRVLYVYASIQIVQFSLFTFLSSAIEVPPPTILSVDVSSSRICTMQCEETSFLGLQRSKKIVFHLSLLFMLDSFAGSFVLQSIISSWLYDTFHTSSNTLGDIIFFCNIIAGISALFAVQIARTIGLLLTMVVTHLPSNILLILVPIMPNETAAIVMLCLRFSISQMDVPTRNAYVQGVVDADERSAANGVTNVVRSIGASIGPLLCGLLMSYPQYRNFPFYVAGSLKIVYDLLLLRRFQSLKSTSDFHQTTKIQTQRLNDENIALISIPNKV
jgi:MFS family permease